MRPILLDLKPSEVTGPLNQFQATVATDGQDMLKLVKSLNNSCDVPLEDTRLERVFHRTWADYLADVEKITNATPTVEHQREIGDMLEEVLERVRDMQRSFVQVVGDPPSSEILFEPRRPGISGLVMADLRDLAKSVGIEDPGGMRKGDLISAIKERQLSNQGSSEEE